MGEKETKARKADRNGRKGGKTKARKAKKGSKESKVRKQASEVILSQQAGDFVKWLVVDRDSFGFCIFAFIF